MHARDEASFATVIFSRFQFENPSYSKGIFTQGRGCGLRFFSIAPFYGKTLGFSAQHSLEQFPLNTLCKTTEQPVRLALHHILETYSGQTLATFSERSLLL